MLDYKTDRQMLTEHTIFELKMAANTIGYASDLQHVKVDQNGGHRGGRCIAGYGKEMFAQAHLLDLTGNATPLGKAI